MQATTGLDSTSAAAVVAILARLSKDGVTVALSIHQPRLDIFCMLSHLLILSGDGRMVFSGPTAAAEPHFTKLGHTAPENANVADFLLDVVIRATPAEAQTLVDKFVDSDENCALAELNELLSYAAALRHPEDAASDSLSVAARLEALCKYQPPFKLQVRRGARGPRARACLPRCVTVTVCCVQAKLLARRKLRSLLRHPWLLAFAFGATLATAALLGAVYTNLDRATPGIQNRFAAFFFIILYLALVSLSSIPVWQAERGLFLRERAAGVYDTAAYVATSVTADLLFMRVLPPLLLAALAYPLMGLRAGAAHFAAFAAALVLASVAAAAMSMAIGAACASTSAANMLGSIAVLVNMLFGGFLMSLHALPWAADALSRLSLARYAYNILACAEFAGAQDFMLTPFTPPGVDPATLPHKDVSGDDILRIFYFRRGTLAADLCALVLLAAGYVALTAAVLHMRR
jgi:ATP-binding cassette, subfamily G (WHITE), member 2